MASARALLFSDACVLLLQRSTQVSRPLQWCLPGGRILANESPEAAVIRETEEETGLKIQILQSLKQWQKTYYFHCQLAPENQHICLNLRESQNYRWVKAQELEKMARVMDKRLIQNLIHDLNHLL